MTDVKALADELRYIAAILEANASKFVVLYHIPQKARKCREAADLLARTAAQPEREAVLGQALQKIAAPIGNEPLPGDHDYSPGKQVEFWRKLAIDYRRTAIRALKTTPAPPTEDADRAEKSEALLREYRVSLFEAADELLACAPMMSGREGFGDVMRALGQARATLAAIDAHLAGEPGQGDEAHAIAALRSRVVGADAMRSENERLRLALEEVQGCFDAAYAEGLAERLAEAEDNEPSSLPGLFARRLTYAHGIARAALSETRP